MRNSFHFFQFLLRIVNYLVKRTILSAYNSIAFAIHLALCRAHGILKQCLFLDADFGISKKSGCQNHKFDGMPRHSSNINSWMRRQQAKHNTDAILLILLRSPNGSSSRITTAAICSPVPLQQTDMPSKYSKSLPALRTATLSTNVLTLPMNNWWQQWNKWRRFSNILFDILCWKG